MDGNSDQHKPGERIAKVIARAGLASRREAELWIEAGRVAVNDEVIRSAALNVTAQDRISVDGEPLPARERTRLFLYHKPRGLITTHADPQGRPTIFQKLPAGLPRLISVGRLDFNTEGLLLLTNDGELARVLELPATGWLRRYRVRAHGAITQDKLDALRRGITISGINYGAIEATLERLQGANLWLTFAIREGKNREVRTILAHLGLDVTRLIRVSFGPFQLAELEEGAVEEVRTRVLREQLGDKLIAQAELDFSAPVTARALPDQKDDARRERRPERREREDARVTAWPAKPAAGKAQQKRRGRDAAHVWRAPDEGRPTKKLQRKFRGAHNDGAGKDAAREKPHGKMRAETLTDRKGRPVAVERYGEPPARETPRSDHSQREKFSERPARSGARPDKHRNKPSGRRVAVERYGEPPAREKPRSDHAQREKFSERPARSGARPDKHRNKPSGRRRAADRAGGARPRQPKGKGKD